MSKAITPMQVLKIYMLNRRAFERYPVNPAEDLESDHQPIFEAIQAFYEKYPAKMTITRRALSVFVEPKDRGELKAICHCTVPREDEQQHDAVRTFAQLREQTRLIQEMSDDISKGKLDSDKIMSMLSEVQQKYAPQTELVSLNKISFKKATRVLYQGAVPTPSKTLTKLLDGGPSAGELMLFLTATDGGKTMTLVNYARNLAELGHKVLFVTCESPIQQIVSRWMCSAAQKPMTYFYKQHEDGSVGEYTEHGLAFVRRYRKWLESVGGEIQVMDKSDEDCRVADVVVAAERYRRDNNFTFSTLIIDHCDDLRSVRGYEPGSVREVREVCVELCRATKSLGVPIITASQLNRQGMKAGSDADITDVAEGFAKATKSQIVVFINRQREHKHAECAELRILKTKKSGGYGSVEVVFNTKLGYMGEDLEIAPEKDDE